MRTHLQRARRRAPGVVAVLAVLLTAQALVTFATAFGGQPGPCVF